MFATKALLATFKRTTGIVGLPVIQNAREVLTGLYDKTLENVKVWE
jgi:subunit NDUFA5